MLLYIALLIIVVCHNFTGGLLLLRQDYLHMFDRGASKVILFNYLDKTTYIRSIARHGASKVILFH